MFRKASYVLVFLGSVGLLFATCSPAGVDGQGGNGTGSSSGSGGRGGSGTNTAGGTGKGGNGTGSTSGTGGGFDPGFGDGGIIVTDATMSNNGGEFGTDALLDCGFSKFNVERTPPNVMVVLDRSGSMRRTVEGCMVGEANCSSVDRWKVAVDAINGITAPTEANISWGLKMFPTCIQPGIHDQATGNFLMPPNQVDKNNQLIHPHRCDDSTDRHNPCAMSGMLTGPGLNRSKVIADAMASARPVVDSGATPTGKGIDAAVAALKAINDNRPKFIVLVTDGTPVCGAFTGSNCKVSWSPTTPGGCNMCGSAACEQIEPGTPNRCLADNPVSPEVEPACAIGAECDKIGGCDASAAAVKAVQDAAKAGIPVFVVGFAIPDASSTNLAHLTLNQLATAGGRAVNDNTYKYYNADDKTSLAKALNEIAASTVSCTFALDETPAEDAVAFVTVDDRTLPSDPQDGWSYGAGRNSIIFNGTSCARLKAGDFKKTAITFGCPQKLPEPPPIVE